MQEWSPENENGEPVVTSEGPQQGGLSRTGVLNRRRGGKEWSKRDEDEPTTKCSGLETRMQGEDEGLEREVVAGNDDEAQ